MHWFFAKYLAFVVVVLSVGFFVTFLAHLQSTYSALSIDPVNFWILVANLAFH
jgi:hypothetical protein